MILALDPGTTQTGWCEFDRGHVVASDVTPNDVLLARLAEHDLWIGCELAIEMIASYGMPVGREVFETCVWIGRFKQAWRDPEAVRLVYRKDVKMHLCGTPRAKDANVWQALKDKLGDVGTKGKPGPLYGVTSHARAALAVAVTVEAQLKGELA